MTAALIHYLQLCLSCQKPFPWRTKKTREQYCCQPDILFKSMAEKTRPHEGKRKGRTVIFVQHSPRVPGESHMPDFFCLSENTVLFSRCTPCFSIPLYSGGGGRQTKYLTPVSYPFLTGKSQDPYNSNTVSLKTLSFHSGLDCTWKLLTWLAITERGICWWPMELGWQRSSTFPQLKSKQEVPFFLREGSFALIR